MNLDALIRTHAQARIFIPSFTSVVADYTFSLDELTKLLGKLPLVTTMNDQFAGMLGLQQNSQRVAQLRTIDAYSRADLDALITLPQKNRQFLNTEEGDYLQQVSDVLELPQNIAKRQTRIHDLFSPLYSALNSTYKKVMADLETASIHDVAKLVRPGLDNKEGAGYTWALAQSTDPLKNTFAMAIFAGGFDYIASIGEHLNILYKTILTTFAENDKLHKQHQRMEGKLGNAVGGQKKLEEQLNTLRKQAKQAEQQRKQLEEELQQANTRIEDLEHSEEYKTLQEELITTRNEAAENLKLAQSYDDEINQSRSKQEQLEQKLQTAGRVLHMAKRDVARLQRQLSEHYPLSNGTNITVYAGQDLKDRYTEEIYGYTDANLDEPFSDIIDEVIKHLCSRIKQHGRSIENKEFEYMKQVSCHFYKKNDTPAKWTRIFFTTNWEDEITLYDIITPEEHDDKLQHNRGRYQAILDGKIEYDKERRVQIKGSIRDLL